MSSLYGSSGGKNPVYITNQWDHIPSNVFGTLPNQVQQCGNIVDSDYITPTGTILDDETGTWADKLDVAAATKSNNIVLFSMEANTYIDYPSPYVPSGRREQVVEMIQDYNSELRYVIYGNQGASFYMANNEGEDDPTTDPEVLAIRPKHDLRYEDLGTLPSNWAIGWECYEQSYNTEWNTTEHDDWVEDWWYWSKYEGQRQAVKAGHVLVPVIRMQSPLRPDGTLLRDPIWELCKDAVNDPLHKWGTICWGNWVPIWNTSGPGPGSCKSGSCDYVTVKSDQTGDVWERDLHCEECPGSDGMGICVNGVLVYPSGSAMTALANSEGYRDPDSSTNNWALTYEKEGIKERFDELLALSMTGS